MDIYKNYPVHKMKIKTAWNEFIKTGAVKEGSVREDVLESWKRSRDLGIDPYSEDLHFLDKFDLQKIITKNKLLINAAQPFLEHLFQVVIKEMDMTMFLTDRNGVVLVAIGEGEIWNYCNSIKAVAGSCFNECYTGTTAPSMALRKDTPYQLVVEEHYLQVAHVASCAAAPIHDVLGNLIGSICITCSYKTSQRHPHSLGMAVSAAKVIENDLQLSREMNNAFVANQYLSAAIDGMTAGLIILNEDDRIHHLNNAAVKIMGLRDKDLKKKEIGAVLDNKILLEALARRERLHDCEVLLNNSRKTSRCIVTMNPIVNSDSQKIGTLIILKEPKEVHRLVKRVVGLDARYNFSNIWGVSPSISKTIELSKKVAKSSSNIVICGESGTGKEMFAQSIHNFSPYAKGPFLGINCSAIPNDLIESELFGYEAGTFTGALNSGKPGRFELANGGTIFFDEVNAMSLDLQAKLLRVLEEKRFNRIGGKQSIKLDARIISASNKNLLDEVERGNFREDLYYRLNVVEIHVPPLRERREDIPVLIKNLVNEISSRLGKQVKGISEEAMFYLENQNWPGNVRQLRNWMERAINLADSNILTLNDFPKDIFTSKMNIHSSHPPYLNNSLSLSDIEREKILNVLKENSGNIALASKSLKIGRSTLYRKMEKYGFLVKKNISN